MSRRRSFASGLNFYKLVWVFLIFSVAGWYVEMLFVPILHNGLWESRNGLLYGPISQIYGIGAILIILLLNRFSTYETTRGNLIIFFSGASIGSIFEWVASYAQQVAFGTISWDYSGRWGSIGIGRINVLFTIFWGFAALGLIKILYPFVSNWVERIPDQIGRLLTWLIFVLLFVDIALTAGATWRWQERAKDIPPASGYEELLDERYPDFFMEEIFPNMKPAHQRDKLTE